MVESACRQTESERPIALLLEMVTETAGDPLSELLIDGFIIADARGVVTYANLAAKSLFGRLHGKGDIVGTGLDRVCLDPSIEKAVLVDGVCVNREVRVQDRVLLVKAVPLYRDGKITSYGMTIRDITEAREKDKELAAQSAVIREVHHRVKNNLQTIVSLLGLQQRRIASTTIKEVLADCIDRILAVSAVHEVLSMCGMEVTDVREVAERIVTMQQGAWQESGKSILARISGDRILLDGKRAVSVALVINELTHNALRHAFRGRTEGRIDVTFEDRGRSVVLRVSDDGAGFPEAVLLGEPRTLGFTIVRTLVVDGLKGSIKMSNRNGAYVEVEFPKL